MKSINSYGLKICAFQAKLFEQSVSNLNCSSQIFVRRFMYSDLAARMDSNGYYFDATGISDAFDELERQYGTTAYGRKKYSTEEMHWIGYIYRYWVYTHEKSSKQLFRYIKPEKLRDLYFPYHSFDPAQAIERILESDGMDSYDEIARGVEIIRKVRRKYGETGGE